MWFIYSEKIYFSESENINTIQQKLCFVFNNFVNQNKYFFKNKQKQKNYFFKKRVAEDGLINLNKLNAENS